MIDFPPRWLILPEQCEDEIAEMWSLFRDVRHTTGFCIWCEGELKNRRQKKFCSQDCSHIYCLMFSWQDAAKAALKRAKNHCQMCGVGWRGCVAFSGRHNPFDVHHIIPLNGEDRDWHPLNYPSNLIVLCHDCHVAIHVRLNELNRGIVKDMSKSLQIPMELGQC
jgi:hypothetical protein